MRFQNFIKIGGVFKLTEIVEGVLIANLYMGLRSQGLAQLGFVGIIVDGFAKPLRSKKMHDYVYGKP